MDSIYWRLRQSPWLSPVLWSFLLHLGLVIVMMFIVIPSKDNPNEHVTPPFRVKGVRELPLILGTPGGGQTRLFRNPRPAGKDARFTASTVKDVSLDTLVRPPDPLDRKSVV